MEERTVQRKDGRSGGAGASGELGVLCKSSGSAGQCMWLEEGHGLQKAKGGTLLLCGMLGRVLTSSKIYPKLNAALVPPNSTCKQAREGSNDF